MTVAYDGQRNRIGALAFILGLVLLVAGLGGALLGFIRLYSNSSAGRRLSRAAGCAGLVLCAAFTGVALTPENRVLALPGEARS